MSTARERKPYLRWIADNVDGMPVGRAIEAGQDARFSCSSDYVEHYWTAVIGPSSALALRFLHDRLWHGEPDETPVDVVRLAYQLGMADSSGGIRGVNSPVVKALDRLVLFGLCLVDLAAGRPKLLVYDRVPPVPYRKVVKWPDAMRQAHDDRVAGVRRRG